MENVGFYLKQLPTDIRSQYPCLLIDIGGPMVHVFGIVNVTSERAICEPLAPACPMLDGDNEWLLTTLARTFSALKVAIRELRDWTQSERKLATAFLPPHPALVEFLRRPRFPFKDTIRGEGEADAVTIQYKRVVGQFEFEAWHPGMNQEDIVKFAQRRYGTQVHEFCHAHGLAPALYYHETLAGGWCFLVMEKMHAELVSPLLGGRSQLQHQLNALLKLLQSSGFVHGDLRVDSLRWDPFKGRLLVTDFSWAGKHGEARYPGFLTSEASWPEGVDVDALIRPEHDAEWVR